MSASASGQGLDRPGQDRPGPELPDQDRQGPDRQDRPDREARPGGPSPDPAPLGSVSLAQAPPDPSSRLRRLAGRLAPYLASLALWAALVGAARLALGPALAPGPLPILEALASLAAKGELFVELGRTMFRALAGALLACLAGTLLGLAAGRAARAMRWTAPLVAALQSCPPIVWISLAMVWAGTGGLVPVATVFASTLPLVFSNTAQGVMGVDPRLRAMSRLYDVPWPRAWARLVLPSVAPYWLAGLSMVLATGWKAAAVAEFMGSHDGVGARLFWSYNYLRMELLNAWALALIALGLTLEALVITPLRRRASSLGAGGRL